METEFIDWFRRAYIVVGALSSSAPQLPQPSPTPVDMRPSGDAHDLGT